MAGYSEHHGGGRGLSLVHDEHEYDNRLSANANAYYQAQAQAQAHHSRAASAGGKSWVSYDPNNPQYPRHPPEEVTPQPTPGRQSRPLPVPGQHMQYSQYSHNPTVLRLTNPSQAHQSERDEDEDEDMYHDGEHDEMNGYNQHHQQMEGYHRQYPQEYPQGYQQGYQQEYQQEYQQGYEQEYQQGYQQDYQQEDHEEYQEQNIQHPPVRRVPVPAPPVEFQSRPFEDVGPLEEVDPPETPRRGFVGGFFSGLRRLPKVLTRRSSSKKKKDKKDKKAKYGEGSEEDRTPTIGAELERGNTLPLYTENPGPNVSRPVYEEAPQTPPPMRAEYGWGQNLGPSLSSNLGRRVLSVHVTPPSDIDEADENGITPEIPHQMPGGMGDHDHDHDLIPIPPTITEEPEPLEPESPEPLPIMPMPVPMVGGNTVTVYRLPGEERYTAVPTEGPSPPPPSPPPDGPPVIPPSPTRLPPPVTPLPPSTAPSQSIRRNGSRSSAGTHGMAGLRSPLHLASPPRSSAPVQAHLRPAQDYAKMGDEGAARTSYTSDLSDGPSFTEQLNPVFRFVRALWYMPWVAPKRVTVDYRPAGRGRKSKYGIAEPKVKSRTWYRGLPGVVMSPKSAATSELNIEPPEPKKKSRPISGMTTATTATRWVPAPSTRPTRRRSNESYRRHHRRPHYRSPHRTHRHDPRRDTASSVGTGTGTQFSAFRLRTPSPVLPGMYPYPYAFPPYGFQPFQAPDRMERRKSNPPRGPRHHRQETSFPNGYTPYPPFAAPQPMYLVQATSPGSSGETSSGPAQMLVPVQMVPGAFNPESHRHNRRASGQSTSTK